jgi:uncharacterized damage-inducible protein DinB
MKEILMDYARFNRWANERLLDVAGELSDDELHQEITSSFKGIYKTFFHYWSAEQIWLYRLEERTQISLPEDQFGGSMSKLSAALKNLDQTWEAWVDAVSGEQHLRTKLHYRNLKKEAQEQLIYRIILHVFNHNTYHRGQLVTLFRQVGRTKIPATDFSLWSMERN